MRDFILSEINHQNPSFEKYLRNVSLLLSVDNIGRSTFMFDLIHSLYLDGASAEEAAAEVEI